VAGTAWKITVEGMIILKWIIKEEDGDLAWIAVADNRDKGRAVFNTSINSGFNKTREIFLTT
jgi:hypothetical protein